ncbi:NADH-ubiquinone oxidoreductase assembly factor N7BML [Madurella mycetomatis]|uniref:NADH-ubiquinone oxidoreductase assembly factor N7BML n=1 Tax=Madurella mycetomatis TaxID=100816 RepID=A0A175WAC6_9PEZI|nr:NADH-ubiquinone oxidoreductase assembly factor N7BML [Madurella mycetomatis]
MSQKPISPLLQAWYKWKMLRLPWRRQFLVGLDLHGNTYWEFLDRGSPLPPSTTSTPTGSATDAAPVRWRRIVRYPRGTHHDAVNVSPAWHQWLRHTRAVPPSLAEQRADVARQERIKVLAAEADARWEAKPRLVGRDTQGSGVRAALGVREPMTATTGGVPGAVPASEGKERSRPTMAGAVADEAALTDGEVVNQREDTWKRMQEEASAKEKASKGAGGIGASDPWKKAARGGPSETWQPQAWDPSAGPKK